MKRSIAIAMGASVLALVSITAWTLRARPEVEVERAEVTSGPITRRILATGTVQPTKTVEVGVQVSGIVQSLDADFNSIVRAGQVIARLDSRVYQGALDESRAALHEAEAASDQAEADVTGLRAAEADARQKLARASELAATKLIPEADLEAAQIAVNEAVADVSGGDARVTQARAAIARAKADVDQATIDLDHTVIRSPIDGIVVSREVEVGQTLTASIQAPVLFRIATDFRHMQLQVEVDESDVDGVEQGEPASFVVESYPDETFHGTVTQLRVQPVAEAVATAVSYTAVVEVANPDEQLRPGMTAEVSFAGSRRDRAVRIPNRALAFHPSSEVLDALDESEGAGGPPGGSSAVWTYDGMRLRAVAVRVGIADGRWTELVSGPIRPGDAVVTGAALRHR